MFCEACVYVVLYTVLHSRYTANYKVWTQSFSTQSDISSLFLTQHPTQGHQLFSGFMQQAKKSLYSHAAVAGQITGQTGQNTYGKSRSTQVYQT